MRPSQVQNTIELTSSQMLTMTIPYPNLRADLPTSSFPIQSPQSVCPCPVMARRALSSACRAGPIIG